MNERPSRVVKERSLIATRSGSARVLVANGSSSPALCCLDSRARDGQRQVDTKHIPVPIEDEDGGRVVRASRNRVDSTDGAVARGFNGPAFDRHTVGNSVCEREVAANGRKVGIAPTPPPGSC